MKHARIAGHHVRWFTRRAVMVMVMDIDRVIDWLSPNGVVS